MKKLIPFLSLTLLLFGYGCKDNDPVTPPSGNGTTVGKVEFEFENMVGTDVLELLTHDYVNANGEMFQVSKFNYYISNIKLKRTDGFIYSEPESYHIIKAEDESSHSFGMNYVPTGHYTELSFMIGVDSARNVSGSQTGALDPVHNMFWSWSSGYIMVKMEGTSTTSPSGNLKFHVGGFEGANNVLKTVTIVLPEELIVESKFTSMIHMACDLNQMFSSPMNISFATMYDIHMPGSMANTIADNYADMFSVEHVHNYSGGH